MRATTHKQKVLACFVHVDKLTVPELARRTGLTQPQVFTAASRLSRERVLDKVKGMGKRGGYGFRFL